MVNKLDKQAFVSSSLIECPIHMVLYQILTNKAL